MHLTPLWSKSPDGEYRLPDTTILLAVLGVTALVVLAGGPELIRIPLALFAALVLPGYALTTALFPENHTSSNRTYSVTDPFAGGESMGNTQESDDGISPPARYVLSIGLSLAVVVLNGLLLDTIGIQLTTETLLIGVVAVTIAGLALATVRRGSLPESQRFAPAIVIPNREGVRTYRPDVLTIVLVFSVIFAGGALAYSETVDTAPAMTTEFYFVSEAGAGPPVDLTTGVVQPYAVAVDSSADAARTYTLVGLLQTADRGDSGVTVSDQREFARQQVTAEPGASTQLSQSVTPREAGTYRIVFLLYEGDAPENPDTETAFREIHLWVTVTDAAST